MRWILIAAALLGASSVIIGASLRHIGGEMDMDVLQTALRYHQLHSVVLLALGLYALDKQPSIRIMIPAILFTAGIIIFSGSLYGMVVLSMLTLGYLTPFGGTMLIAGWFSIAFIVNAREKS